MHATHIKLKDSKTEIKAMDSIKKDLANVGFSKEAFSYARFYVGWETNKVCKYSSHLIESLLFVPLKAYHHRYISLQQQTFFIRNSSTIS